jgi:hypothetical protein
LVVAEHMMLCFQSRDPHLSLEPVVRGHAEAPEDATSTGVKDVALVVAEHVMLCFQSRDPHLSLEPVVRGHAEEPEDAASTSVKDAARIVAERFEQEPKDT